MTDCRHATEPELREELRALMAALSHDLRTPLAAVYGEVDLALRRDRTAATYRDALERIRAGLGELLDLSADLSRLGEEEPASPAVARLDSVLAELACRYPGVLIGAAAGNRAAAGDGARLARALGLVIEHVRKCDAGEDPVTLEDVAADRNDASVIRLVVRTGPGGVMRRAGFRLRAAAHMLRSYGGELELRDGEPGAAIEVRLQARVAVTGGLSVDK
jgi:hypothetical protein